MNYYEEIKNELISNEITKRVKDYSKNKSDLTTYYNVGKLLIEAQGGEARAKYGDRLIKEYSRRLTTELGKGYSTRNLKNMRKFYLYVQKGQPMVAQLSWTHYLILLSITDNNKIKYYIDLCIKENLSKRELQDRIKNQEYERLNADTKLKLIENKEMVVSDFVKNPIIITSDKHCEKISEKTLQKLIMEDIDNFLKELGQGFCYIESEYKIKLGNTYNYIDLLLFNIKFNCYVVVELKVTELKKEHIGQIQIYMNYVDEHIKDITHNKTIGIIIVKENNSFIIKYSSDKRIVTTEFRLENRKMEV